MYKYLKKKYADLLFNENNIRIGTLYGYRDMEDKEENKGRYDPLEGKYEDHLKIDSFNKEDYFGNPKLRENIGNLLDVDEGAISSIQVNNLTVITERHSPNYLIFCIAHTKSQDIMKEFDGADTCFHIHKPITFFQLITWSLENELGYPIEFLGVHPVVYGDYKRDRFGIESEHIHPALAKTNIFIPQCELRAIWKVEGDSLITKPFYDLNVVGLRKYCRLVDLWSFTTAFATQQEIHFNGFIEKYSQIISDGSADTSRLDVNEEALQSIVMRLPEPEY